MVLPGAEKKSAVGPPSDLCRLSMTNLPMLSAGHGTLGRAVSQPTAHSPVWDGQPSPRSLPCPWDFGLSSLAAHCLLPCESGVDPATFDLHVVCVTVQPLRLLAYRLLSGGILTFSAHFVVNCWPATPQPSAICTSVLVSQCRPHAGAPWRLTLSSTLPLYRDASLMPVHQGLRLSNLSVDPRIAVLASCQCTVS